MDYVTYKEIEEILNMHIDENEQPYDIEENFYKLNKNFSILYNFVLSYNSYSNRLQTYNYSNESLSMIEAHILLDIISNPKITVTALSVKWKKTTSAISQTLKKLIQKGYVIREISSENAKFFHLYPTQKAKEFTLYHKHYDNIDIVKTIKKLHKNSSIEEIVAFYKVMNNFIEILDESSREKKSLSNSLNKK